MHDYAYIGDVQRITLNASCMTISGERTEQLYIFCHVTGFTSDFLSFIDVELRFFHRALQLYCWYIPHVVYQSMLILFILVTHYTLQLSSCCYDLCSIFILPSSLNGRSGGGSVAKVMELRTVSLGRNPTGIHMSPWWQQEGHPVKIAPVCQKSPTLVPR